MKKFKKMVAALLTVAMTMMMMPQMNPVSASTNADELFRVTCEPQMYEGVAFTNEMVVNTDGSFTITPNDGTQNNGTFLITREYLGQSYTINVKILAGTGSRLKLKNGKLTVVSAADGVKFDFLGQGTAELTGTVTSNDDGTATVMLYGIISSGVTAGTYLMGVYNLSTTQVNELKGRL